jgi:AcrR family transcriptional regulator
MLYDGLATLIREKGFDAITVTDLVEVAKVGRATFYRNFDTIEDVLRLRCDQTCDGFIAYFTEYRRQHDSVARFPRLKPLLRYFDMHSDIIELLLLANRIYIFATSFRRVLWAFRSQITTLPDLEEEYLDYGLAIRTGVTITILVRWIETGKKQTPDELADRLSPLIQGMVRRDQLL